MRRSWTTVMLWAATAALLLVLGSCSDTVDHCVGETCAQPSTGRLDADASPTPPPISDMDGLIAAAADFVVAFRRQTEQLVGGELDPQVVAVLLTPVCSSTVALDEESSLALAQMPADLLFARSMCYATGTQAPQSNRRAIELSLVAGKRGQPDALTFLGTHHRQGVAVKKDEARALKFYQMAADQGHTHATFLLGTCFSEGVGGAPDDKRAFKLFQQAANGGHIEANLLTAMSLAQGVGVAKSEQRALEPLGVAADAGHAMAQYILGLWTDEGTVVEQNRERATSLFQLAADQGHADAQLQMALRLSEGAHGVPRNDGHAVAMLQASAAQSNTHAQYLLGISFVEGRGVKVDLARAQELFQLAADAGHAQAEKELSKLQQPDVDEREHTKPTASKPDDEAGFWQLAQEADMQE